MDVNDIVIIAVLLTGVSLFTWFIFRLLTKYNINKFNLELKEWLKIKVERGTEQGEISTTNHTMKNIPNNNKHGFNEVEPSEMWDKFDRNMEGIKSLSEKIRINNKESSKRFPITTDILRKMKNLRERYESVGSAVNITRAELSKLTETSFEVMEFLNNIEE